MNKKEFDSEYENFLNQFNKAFDTPDTMNSIRESVQTNLADKSNTEQMLAFEHQYQKLRTDHLIKAVAENFLLQN